MSQFIIPFKGILPKIEAGAFIAQNAAVIGDVEIGAESSVWYGCALRGDVNPIRIGKRTNIQDGTVIHTTHDFQGTYIGDNVTVGHMAILHACTVEDYGFVGMQACAMDGAVVKTKGMLAAGALLTPGKVVPSGQLWAGRPAKFMRDLTAEELAFLSYSADHYVKLSREYL
jgi:carbonic anhydrase/acetyltransferase-like protein (isoleucine patch superfamily)